ncbi:MAG: hypothetical protein U0235_29730 [Polyangiaceae bacterium]
MANRSGWKSFGAAMVGAVLLFTTGAIKLVRSWLSAASAGAPRVCAYLLGEVERIGEARAEGSRR